MESLALAFRGNPLIPTPHWEPRCEICRLRRTNADAYGWLTRQLQGAAGDGSVEPLTQTEIAAELSRMTGLSITQSQVSTHKCKHFDPSLADAVESLTGHLVLMDYVSGMEPRQMAVAYLKLALVQSGKLLAEASGAKAAAPLAGAIAACSRALLGADREASQAQIAGIEAKLAEIKLTAEDGRFEDLFGTWIEEHYPDLVPLLADPALLQRLLAEYRAGAAGAAGA